MRVNRNITRSLDKADRPSLLARLLYGGKRPRNAPTLLSPRHHPLTALAESNCGWNRVTDHRVGICIALMGGSWLVGGPYCTPGSLVVPFLSAVTNNSLSVQLLWLYGLPTVSSPTKFIGSNVFYRISKILVWYRSEKHLEHFR